MSDTQPLETGWITIPGFSRYSYHPDLRMVRRDAVTDAEGRVLRKPFVLKSYSVPLDSLQILKGGKRQRYRRERSNQKTMYGLIADGRINGDKGYKVNILENRIRRLLGCPYIGGREPAPVSITDTQTGRTYPSIQKAAIGAGVSSNFIRRHIHRFVRAGAQ